MCGANIITGNNKNITRKILGYLFRIFGAICFSFGIVCFLGGPDGKIGNIETIEWGMGYLFGGCVFVVIGKLFYKNIK